jgi:hypothetical protein
MSNHLVFVKWHMTCNSKMISKKFDQRITKLNAKTHNLMYIIIFLGFHIDFYNLLFDAIIYSQAPCYLFNLDYL